MLRLFAIVLSACGVLMLQLNAAEPEPVADAFARAAQSGKPVLMLVRHLEDMGTIDCAHWIAEEAEAHDSAVNKFEHVVIWHGDDALKGIEAPKDGLAFFTSKGEVIGWSAVPAYRSKFEEALKDILAAPTAIDTLLAAANAELARPKPDTSHFGELIRKLRGMGRLDEAVPFQRALSAGSQVEKSKTAADDALDLAVLELETHTSQPGRLKALAKEFDAFRNAAKPIAGELRVELHSAARTTSFSGTVKQLIAPVQTAFSAYEKAPDSADALKAVREALGKAAPALRAESEAMKNPMKELEKQFAKEHPDSLHAKFHEFSELLEKLGHADADKRCQELVNELLKRPMKPEEFIDVAGYLNYAIINLQLGPERGALAERTQKEIRTGRYAADIYMDQADLYFSEGKTDEAEKLWRLASDANENGNESYSYLHAIRSVLGLKNSNLFNPNGTKWANRTILNTVVLAPDFESYANAIAQWTDKEFFPVLFQDDLYAPKFIAAFKPASVLILPAAANAKNAIPPMAALRRSILSSWSPTEAKAKLAAEPDDKALDAQLREIGAIPLGVVFGDGKSGEMAGALALAAGRFQPLELLPRPTVGSEGHIGSEDNYLDWKRAVALNDAVREALHRWHLPSCDQWAYVTLAGKYPYRYIGEQTHWGSTYATDDLLGRDEDFLRIAVCGRLMGDTARSAYQAMCSLFLQPDSAFLFNTYGTDPHSEWGQFRMDIAESLLKDRMKITHFHDDGANIDTFRAHEIPWNRDGLIFINSSGGPEYWSVAGGGGTPEDFMVGGPCAIHVVHSGSAGDLYNTETLAHRAVWGGAFWYYGSAAEPLLDAFNPLSYVAPRIVRGVPLAAAFRQRAAQNHFYPWRLLLVGDPQFCLREKPAKRIEMSDALRKALVPADAPSADAKPLTWADALRSARFHNDSAQIAALLQKLPDAVQFDGAAAAITLEEFLKAGRCADAVKLWRELPEAARKHYAARLYARYAAGHLMDMALAAKDFKALTAAFSDVLSGDPPRNYVERWARRAATLAREQKADADYVAWLTELSTNPHAAAFQNYFQTELLNHKEKWSSQDKAAALANFAELVKAQGDANQLAAPFKSLAANYLAKLPGSTADQLEADAKALFKDGAPAFKHVLAAMEPFEISQQLYKDWLLLGPFKDPNIGAWEKVGPRDGKLAPDFSAAFTDGAELRWTRPFKGAAPGTIDLLPIMKPNTNVYAYAAATVVVEKDVDALLLLGSDDGITAWLDGKEIHRNAVNRGVKLDEDKVPVKLSAGTHSLVLRIDQSTGGWGFCARIADKDGKLTPAGVTLRCPRDE